MKEIKTIPSKLNRPQQNRGAVLFISLMILLVLTIIGLSAMDNSHVELQIASNTQEKNISDQAAESGINAVMCLSNTTDNNPFDKTYERINIDGTNPGSLFNWSWDRTSYDTQNISPFKDNNNAVITVANCSISAGKLSIGNNVNNDLAVAVRRSDDSASLRAINGNSYKELECQNYVVDSRYSFTGSGARTNNWAAVCRERIAN